MIDGVIQKKKIKPGYGGLTFFCFPIYHKKTEWDGAKRHQTQGLQGVGSDKSMRHGGKKKLMGHQL